MAGRQLWSTYSVSFCPETSDTVPWKLAVIYVRRLSCWWMAHSWPVEWTSKLVSCRNSCLNVNLLVWKCRCCNTNLIKHSLCLNGYTLRKNFCFFYIVWAGKSWLFLLKLNLDLHSIVFSCWLNAFGPVILLCLALCTFTVECKVQISDLRFVFNIVELRCYRNPIKRAEPLLCDDKSRLT